MNLHHFLFIFVIITLFDGDYKRNDDDSGHRGEFVSRGRFPWNRGFWVAVNKVPVTKFTVVKALLPTEYWCLALIFAALAGSGLRTARGARIEEPMSHQARRGGRLASEAFPFPLCEYGRNTFHVESACAHSHMAESFIGCITKAHVCLSHIYTRLIQLANCWECTMIASMNKKLLPMVLAAILISLSGCSYQDTNFFNDHIIDMWAQTLEPYSVDIAFFGDSRVVLANWEEAYPDRDIVNLGIGGDVVEGTIQRLRLLRALDVKYCFLAIGVNNCSRDSFSEAGFRNNYRILLDGLEDLGITVYVNTIAGVTTANSDFSAALVTRMTNNISVANEIIRDLAESRGLVLIDMAEGIGMATGMNNSDGTLKAEYSADGIHFSEEGNQFWYDALRPYMEALFVPDTNLSLP